MTGDIIDEVLLTFVYGKLAKGHPWFGLYFYYFRIFILYTFAGIWASKVQRFCKKIIYLWRDFHAYLSKSILQGVEILQF